ncbi:MAG: exopolyphosphatase [Anaerovibrio sp.]|nr:exopolyphosphatase [Selenomonadaceae bacterium]MDD6398126.1 exopolyphosphatase [Selenomonadaceae bacterium]MDY6054140.1 exopolyphosphatase [Anaerovibrio sp.]
MIQAIIDIGSNTVRMAIYEIKDKNIDFLMKKKHMVGLAAYLENNTLSMSGVDKLCEVLNEFQSFLAFFKIDNLVAFATAALRNCNNREAVLQEIYRRTEINVKIISGDEEAHYDFVAATRSVDEASGLLVDIGGASTELVYFEDKKYVHKISLPMGSLAFKTRYCSSFMPNSYEIGLMTAEALRELKNASAFEGIKSRKIFGIGGTFKGLWALYKGMYQPENNLYVPAEKIAEIIRHFTDMESLGYEDTVLLMKNVPDRIHTIIPGLTIADAILKQFQAEEILYSDSGVREGYIYSEIIKG